jgi:hypothetical protein
MESAADYRDIEDFVRREQETVVRVLLHSDDPMKRAAALTALDRAGIISAEEFQQAVRGEEDDVAAATR